MTKVALLLALLLASSASCVSAASWFWALGGGVDPTTIPTSEGLTAWAYTYYDANAYWESITLSDNDTALRLVDNSTTKKVRWDTTADGIRDDVSSGFTLAFRIKGESISGVAPGTPINIMQFANKLAGISTKNKIAIGIVDNGGQMCLYNQDRSAIIGRIDDGWHTFWSKHFVDNDGKMHFTIYWDGVQVDDYIRTATTTTGAKFGIDSLPGLAIYQLDYLAYSLDGAWNPDDLPIPTAPPIPEPISLTTLMVGVGSVCLLNRRRVR
jgi:hypothetical protein